MTRGYHRPRPHPAAYALSLGGAAAMVAAIALSAPNIVKYVDPVTLIRNIPLPEDPPILPEMPREQPREAKVTTPNRPDPEVVVPSEPVDIGTTLGTFPVEIGVPDTGTPAGTGTETAPVTPPARPAPVLVAAAMARGVVLQPDYPASERRAGIEGAVTVRVLIGSDGRVKTVEPVGTPTTGLFEATRRHALARWRFTPATRDGVPYETWRQFTVRFVLDQA